MTCTSAYQPHFQAQNPAISGDRFGWSNCAAYTGAMGVDYVTCGARRPTGASVRALTTEPIPAPASPGLTPYQVTFALAKLGVAGVVMPKVSWAEIEALVGSGHYVGLSVQYSVIRPTRFSGDPSFYGGHAIGIPPGWDVVDPLADGRRAGIYQYHGEVYPRDLVKRAAGAYAYRSSSGTKTIGYGYAQGWYTAVAHPASVPQTPAGQEDPLNATHYAPVALCDVAGGGTIYADPDRNAVLVKNWIGAKSVGLYAQPVTVTSTVLVPIRIALGSGNTDLRVGYVGRDKVSNVRLA